MPPYKGKTILVTGAGGSIGSALCARLLSFDPLGVVGVTRSERSLLNIPEGCDVHLGSITDGPFMRHIMRGVDIVFHCAAHKHVSICEDNPLEARRNNEVGLARTIHAAQDSDVKHFVFVSTDKAHEPIGVYARTKHEGERIVRDASRYSSIDFKIVRLCNVLWSSGSVLHVWKKQVTAGGPLTLSDPDATRYFIHMDEAVGFLLNAPEMSGIGPHAPGEIEPTRLMDIAQTMIAGTDVEIKITGLSPGEKLHETLVVS